MGDLVVSSSASASTCILITGSNSVFNGNGYRIISTNKQGVRTEGQNITVTNTHITGCSDGISLLGPLSSAFENVIENCSNTGIVVSGRQAKIYSNVIQNFIGETPEGIWVTGGNAIINNNRVEGMVGLPVVGIFYSAEGYAEITNNFVAKLTSPVLASNCWVKVLDASISGIVVNITQSVTVKYNSISEVGGTGACVTLLVTKAIAIHSYLSTSAYPAVEVDYNTVHYMKGLGSFKHTIGISCNQYHRDRASFQVQITNSEIENVESVDGAGIYSDGCSIILQNNTIKNISGDNVYGIKGEGFSTFSAEENRISELFGSDTSIGLHVYLNGPGGSGGLRVLNNQMGLNIEEPYYFQAVGMFNDVCGGITKYKNSNSSCFPPGDNCCGVDCTRLCTICGPSCGIVPENCTNCNYTCGNGICDSAENCTNCSADCDCEVECGDEICDLVQGESCSSCPDDCGTCGPECPRNCTGRGECVETGICECYGNYSGSDCSKITVDFNYDLDTVYPGTSISYNISGEFFSHNISVTDIREVTSNGSLVSSFSVSSDMFEPVPWSFFSILFPNNSNLVKNVYAVLPNGAKMLFTLFIIPERTSVLFGKSKINIAPKSVKFNVQVWDWPFLSIFHQLEIHTDHFSSGDQPTNVTLIRDIFGNVRKQEITTGHNASLFMNVAPYAIVDGFLRRMKVRETSTGVVTTLPFFLFRAIYGPDLSVLVGVDDDSDDIGDDESTGQSTGNYSKPDINVVGIVVGVVVSVAVVAFIAVFVKVIYPKLQVKKAVGDAKKRKSLENVY